MKVKRGSQSLSTQSSFICTLPRTHMYTLLCLHTLSTECNVQRAVRETRSKTVIVTQKTQQCSVEKCNVVGGEGGHTLNGVREGGGTDPPHRKSDLSGGGYIRVRGGGGRPPPTGATHTHTKHPPHSIV